MCHRPVIITLHTPQMEVLRIQACYSCPVSFAAGGTAFAQFLVLCLKGEEGAGEYSKEGRVKYFLYSIFVVNKTL